MPLFNMKNWIVSIVVNLFFISVMSMIMPKGKMATAFKSVTSLLVIIIIIQPIFELKKIDFNFGNIFNYEMDLQTNYLSYVQKTTIENYEKGEVYVRLRSRGYAVFIYQRRYVVHSYVLRCL